MKINSETSNLFRMQRTEGGSPAERVKGSSSFAAILAGKATVARDSDSVQMDNGVKNYDFSNMSPREAKEAMNNLIRSGQMSFDESTSLVGMIPSELSKVNYDGNMPDSFDQPWNFFTKIQEGIEGALLRNEGGTAERLQRTSDALMRFQGKPAKIDIQA